MPKTWRTGGAAALQSRLFPGSRRMSPQPQLFLTDLKNLIARRAVAVVTGAGLSLQISDDPVTTWSGFLRFGAERCCLLNNRLAEDWLPSISRRIATGTPSAMSEAYREVESKLSDGERERLFDDAFGHLDIKHPGAAQALAAWRCPIVTTNFDDLIERVTGLQTATWRGPGRAQRVISGLEPGVLHVHGIYNDPGSLVMTPESYKGLLNDRQAQALLHGLTTMKALVFVGCGATLEDPNFASLFEWCRTHLPGSHFRLYRLVRRQDIEALQKERDDRIILVPYGDSHESLMPFLWSLAPKPKRLWRIPVAFAALAALAAGAAWHQSHVPQSFRLEGVVLMGAQPVASTAVGIPGQGPEHVTDQSGYFVYECPSGDSIDSVNVRIGEEPLNFRLPHPVTKSSFIELHVETKATSIRPRR